MEFCGPIATQASLAGSQSLVRKAVAAAFRYVLKAASSSPKSAAAASSSFATASMSSFHISLKGTALKPLPSSTTAEKWSISAALFFSFSSRAQNFGSAWTAAG